MRAPGVSRNGRIARVQELSMDALAGCVEVDTETGCWIWRHSLDSKGYGYFRLEGKWWGAHRAMYTVAKGEIPDGMTVDHLCFVPRCVNPEHLRLLTPRANSRNQRSALATHCKHGHEFTPDNTYWRTHSPTSRQCRACNREAQRRYQERKRQGVSA